jgi:hypothetical protein
VATAAAGGRAERTRPTMAPAKEPLESSF